MKQININSGTLAENNVKKIYLEKYNIELKNTSININLSGADLEDNSTLIKKYIDVKNNEDSIVFQYIHKTQRGCIAHPYGLNSYSTHIIVNLPSNSNEIIEMTIDEYFKKYYLPEVDINKLKEYLNSMSGYYSKEVYAKKAYKIQNYLKSIIKDDIYLFELNETSIDKYNDYIDEFKSNKEKIELNSDYKIKLRKKIYK